METKKILFIEGTVSFGGSTVGLLNIASNLDKSYYQIIVVCLYSGEHYQILKEKIKDTILIESRILKKVKLFNVPLLRTYHFFRLFVIIKRRKINLIHSNNAIYYPAVLAAKLAGIPCVGHLRSLPVGYCSRRSGVSFFTKFFGKFVDCFISISEAIKKEYIKYGFKANKIFVIGIGMSIKDIERKAVIKDLRKEFSIAKNDFIIGTVARLSWEKGVNFFIEALPAILEKIKNIKCLIVGSGSLEEELKEKTRLMGLAEKFIFTGRLDNPFYALSSFDVFVLPSLKEGRSRTIMEAMALGVPVVASKVGGIVESIEDGVDGLLVEPGNPKDISRAVITLLNGNILRETLQRNALVKAKSKFLIKDKIEQIEALYKKILNEVYG